MAKLYFKYEPITLTRLLLQKYVDQNILRKSFEANEIAHYEFLDLQTDEDIENLLYAFMKKEKREAITFDEWKGDSEKIFSIITESEQFKTILLDYQRKGYGHTGLGVYDRSAKRFYDCGFTGHWDKVKEIMEEFYPDKYEALEKLIFSFHDDVSHNGISKVELDQFILDNFELIGANKDLDFYLND